MNMTFVYSIELLLYYYLDDVAIMTRSGLILLQSLLL